MSLEALQDYTFVSKYARYDSEKKRRETWNEAVERVKGMHLQKYPKISEDIEWAFEQVRNKRVLGSQRALQFGGAPILKKNSRLYNCISSYCDRLRFFQECFWLLLCGCGTGFSVQKHHIAKLPNLIKTSRKLSNKIYVIPDSIEGWADSLGVLLSSYFEDGVFPEYEGYNIIFDYSQIRPEGSPLSSSSGKAPGPKPLKKALGKIQELLQGCIDRKQDKLRPIHAYDIVMHTSDAVLSGGVRRSATICLFSPDDEEMALAKTGNWFSENPQRGRSNNSALLIRNKTSHKDFKKLMGHVRQFGEPGFVWADSTELLVNPCVTDDTLVATYDGVRSVRSLIGKEFNALVDGKPYRSGNNGFWETGVKDVVELTFSSGRVLKLTENHKLMTTHGWKEAGTISFDDEVVVHDHRSGNWRVGKETVCKWTNIDRTDYAKGYCLGSFLADGNISKNAAQMKWWGEDRNDYRDDAIQLLIDAGWINNHHKQNPESNSPCSIIESVKLKEFAEAKGCFRNGKELTPESLEGSWRYLAGLIAGYFDADGTVAVNHEKGCSVRITSISLNNLQLLQVAMNSFGIYSKIYKERYPEGYRVLPDGHGGKKEYYCEATHELCVSCDSIIEFSNQIPIRNKAKTKLIEEIILGYKRTPNRTHFVDRLVSKRNIGKQKVYDCTIEEVHAFDANGIYAHNCVEVGMYPVDIKTMLSGWQACNLSEVNGRYCKTEEDFAIAAKAAAIIGTCQAGYTDLEYLGPVTKRILEREALLGVSITGMMDNPDILFDPELQRKMAGLILEVNERIAARIGINPCARATCVKPAGTSSCVLGTASGIHAHHARRYIRRSQGNWMEAPLQHFKKYNPLAVERSVWSANGTDEVVAFCIEVPKGAKTKNDIDAITLLEHVKLTQQNWVAAGTRKENCVKDWLTHNVSNTITVREDEWENVTNFIYKNRQYFAGISLLPITGDKDYPQAPFTAIYTPKELVQMYGDGSVMASGLIVHGLQAFEKNLWKACDAVLGLGDPITEPIKPESENGVIDMADNALYKIEMREYNAKMDWIRRAKQFASRYFEDDVRKMTYALKDINNWKYWCDLRREYVEVDYTNMIEESDETKLSQEVACAGGACTLSYA